MEKGKFKDEQILQAWKDILNGLNLDLKDANFKGTPERILKSYYEIFEGLGSEEKEIKELFSKAFPSTYGGMVCEKRIKCFSVCPHHFLPVEYEVSVGYISKNGSMLGLSKLPRLVKILARKPMLQETFTQSIVEYLMKYLEADGAIAIVRGRHLCVAMRGIEQLDACTITSEVDGVFKKDASAKAEFLELIKTN